MDITTLLDKRNKELFEEVSRKHTLTFQYSFDETYACYSEEQTSSIYVLKNNSCIDSFTHELLHIYLMPKEMYAGGYLTRRINDDKSFDHLFDREILDHITNVIDHIKMYPIYISLGFEKEKFISDYDSIKCTEDEIKNLKLYHSLSPTTKPLFFKLFAGKFFSMKGCPNDKYNYYVYYHALEDLDFTLFQDLDNFYREWDSYDINKNGPLDISYRDIISELVISFKTWDMTN